LSQPAAHRDLQSAILVWICRAAAPQPDKRISAADDEWATDFKGWFRTRDQRRSDPLTVSDSHSRLLIDVRIAGLAIACGDATIGSRQVRAARSKPVPAGSGRRSASARCRRWAVTHMRKKPESCHAGHPYPASFASSTPG
jgi:hypothetical protein